MKTGVLLLAHGSRRETGINELRDIAQKISASDKQGRIFTLAFLEFSHPTISEAVQDLANSKVKRIIVVPLLLAAGKHLERDIPQAVQKQRKIYPHITFILAKHIGFSPMLADLVNGLIEEAGEI